MSWTIRVIGRLGKEAMKRAEPHLKEVQKRAKAVGKTIKSWVTREEFVDELVEEVLEEVVEEVVDKVVDKVLENVVDLLLEAAEHDEVKIEPGLDSWDERMKQAMRNPDCLDFDPLDYLIRPPHISKPPELPPVTPPVVTPTTVVTPPEVPPPEVNPTVVTPPPEVPPPDVNPTVLTPAEISLKPEVTPTTVVTPPEVVPPPEVQITPAPPAEISLKPEVTPLDLPIEDGGGESKLVLYSILALFGLAMANAVYWTLRWCRVIYKYKVQRANL